MPSVIREGSQYKTAIPVDLPPLSHSVPSCSGRLLGPYADVYHFGAEISSYELSDTDKLVIIASHKKPNPQIILLTHDVDLIHKMPGKRDCSLVAKMVSQVQLYITHSQHYPSPLTTWQDQKQAVANNLLKKLRQLYEDERNIPAENLEEREIFRNRVISLIESASHENLRIANHPYVSTGELGYILYQCKRQAEDYEFNPFKQVSKADQEQYESDGQTCFVWDSLSHLSGSNFSIDDCLQTIASHYQLNVSSNPKHPCRLNRFKQTFEAFNQDANDIVDYCMLPNKPKQTSHVVNSDNIQKTYIDPYYTFQSPDILTNLKTRHASQLPVLENGQTANELLATQEDNSACFSNDKSRIFVKLKDIDNRSYILSYRCFIDQDLIHLLPSLDDLKAVTRASERHLYMPERAWIHFKLFFNHIPAWIKWLGQQTKRIAIEEVYDQIVEQVHRGHETNIKPREPSDVLGNITKEFEKSLPNNMSFQMWLSEYLDDHHYVFSAPAQSTLPSLYTDPIHRVLNIGDHAASFFVGLNERNPILGSFALLAYLFGGMSILAPTALESFLKSMHAQGLTHLIPIAKAIGETMSNGPVTQTISASMTLWQATMLSGQFDKALTVALSTIKENPAEIILVASFAMGLGYSLCNLIPYLRNEMGKFPYTNYAAVGAKGGAACYDTVMHPGDDWLLGTIKWLLKGIRLFAIVLVAPVIEGVYYGWENGFIAGLRKSQADILNALKQIIASLVDSMLLIGIMLFKHGTSLLLNVPFRGITSLLSNAIALFGHVNTIGQSLIQFSKNQFDPLTSFRSSPLYGYNPPIKNSDSNSAINQVTNLFIKIIYTPFFLLKDYIVLALADMTSFSLRLALSITNKICKLLAFTFGYLFVGISYATDPTIGWLCLKIADTITLSANFIDEQAGQLKRQALSQAQIQRGYLYRWAFANEKVKFQTQLPTKSPAVRDPLYLDYLDSDLPLTRGI
jgi:hypothetical protein